MKKICVFTGSSTGGKPAYMNAAKLLGRTLASQGIDLVYGGASIGLMGAVADAALDAGGRVIGVMPKALADLEIAHKGLTELHTAGSMHERKALMADMSDGFVALPGGLGTLDELFEIWTWGQLGYHQKPVALLDVEDFYLPLLAFLDHVTNEGFVKPAHRNMLTVAKTPDQLLRAMSAWEPPKTAKILQPGAPPSP